MNLARVLLDQSPYPTVESDGTLRGGVVLDHPKLCLDCKLRPCRAAAASPAGLREIAGGVRAATCSREVDYARVDVAAESIVVNGVQLVGFHEGRSRRAKKELESRTVETEQVVAWQLSQEKAVAFLEKTLEEEIRLSLEMFHDVQTAASSIVRSAESLQSMQPGRTDEERFASLHPSAQTLVKAASLLELRLRTMPIVSNPSAASYGNKIRKPIYRLIDMLVRTLQPVAAKRNVVLMMRGESRKLVGVYESFDLLPLTLIENAVKYSAPSQSVEVEVNDASHGVSVCVSSFSPWIPLEERQRIFARRYRAVSAIEANREGSGLGLFIAETVAVAHSTHVLLGSDDADVRIGAIRYSNNRFSFSIR